jgi:hypothetical protein
MWCLSYGTLILMHMYAETEKKTNITFVNKIMENHICTTKEVQEGIFFL